MTTLSFYARGDNSTANNAALNVENTSQQPTVQLIFNGDMFGPVKLDGNFGGVDPDTTVTIGGATYNFVLEQTGDLPSGNDKVPDALEGKQVAVISVVISGKTERFFFVTDGSGTFALIEQFANGAIPLDNTNTSPTTVYICFCHGTDILTPSGYRKVELLRPGDMVVNDAGEAVPILWMGQSTASREAMRSDPTRRPIRIPAHSISDGVPYCDLYVSAQHRVVLEGTWSELLFGEARVFVRALHLVGTMADSIMPETALTYFHILLADHEILLANGLATESFQPSSRSYDGIAEDMRRSLSDALPHSALQGYFRRQDALLTLKEHEARLLTERMCSPHRFPKPRKSIRLGTQGCGLHERSVISFAQADEQQQRPERTV